MKEVNRVLKQVSFYMEQVEAIVTGDTVGDVQTGSTKVIR